MPLPRLQEGIFDSFQHYLGTDMTKKEQLEELIDEVGAKDQRLLVFIELMVESFDNSEWTAKQAGVVAALMTYKILESQQAADDLAIQVG